MLLLTHAHLSLVTHAALQQRLVAGASLWADVHWALLLLCECTLTNFETWLTRTASIAQLALPSRSLLLQRTYLAQPALTALLLPSQSKDLQRACSEVLDCAQAGIPAANPRMRSMVLSSSPRWSQTWLARTDALQSTASTTPSVRRTMGKVCCWDWGWAHLHPVAAIPVQLCCGVGKLVLALVLQVHLSCFEEPGQPSLTCSVAVVLGRKQAAQPPAQGGACQMTHAVL